MLTIPFFSFWLILFGWTAGVLLTLWQVRKKRQHAFARTYIRK